jgi:hypothetical protein
MVKYADISLKDAGGVTMNRFKIVREKRPWVVTVETLMEKYMSVVEMWNRFVDSRKGWPVDGRTKEYKAMNEIMWGIIYLQDKIVQVEREKDEEIRRLKFELSKWTSQQTGRRSKLTSKQRGEMKQARADGESCRSIARRYGVSEKTIRRVTTVN